MNISFLIGAGCEGVYNMPLGNDFITKVLLIKSHIVQKDQIIVKLTKTQIYSEAKILLNNVFIKDKDNYGLYFEKNEEFDIYENIYKSILLKNINEGKDYSIIFENLYSSIIEIETIGLKNLCEIILFLHCGVRFSHHTRMNTNTTNNSFYEKEELYNTMIKKVAEKLYQLTSEIVKKPQILNPLKSSFYIIVSYAMNHYSIGEEVYNSLTDGSKNKELDFLIDYFSKVLNINDYLLELMVSYVKNNADKRYFLYSSAANDYLNNIQINENANGIYDWINQLQNTPFQISHGFTTNYTKLIDRCTNFKSIIKIHGELDNYYDFDTKCFVKKRSENNLPYLILQSTAKIIDEVELLNKYIDLYNELNSSSEEHYLFIVGLGLNYDDNHILNLLIKLSNNPLVKIVYLNYHDSTDLGFLLNKFNNKINIESYYPEKLNSTSFQQLLIDSINKG